MKCKIMILIFAAMLMLAGCTNNFMPAPPAGLIPQSSDSLSAWHLPDNIKEQGEGNIYRVVRGSTWYQEPMLELAAAGSGNLEYYLEQPADAGSQLAFRLQFLSTQGVGRIRISALDEQGQIIQSLGWVLTGSLPPSAGAEKWIDVRYNANYQGDWIDAVYNIPDMLAKYFPANTNTQTYRVSIEVGQGQHALISKCSLALDTSRMVRITPRTEQFSGQVGDIFTLEADVQNISRQAIYNTEIQLIEPYGWGMTVVEQGLRKIDSMAPGEVKHLVWKIKAQRADAVNLNKPWTIKFSVNGVEKSDTVKAAVRDYRPGKVFYVMTEDLEPIDSAGYATEWGNQNGWLDPQEYLVQMVQKPNALNQVADKYGARWTHYIAWPAVKAAQWADTKSSTGKWKKVVKTIEESVRTESERGHEYGLHMHSDYDPYLPGNVLSYNEAADGLWANHLRHGWAHSLATDGDLSDRTGRSGLLYDYKRILDELTAGAPQGRSITARAGSFDFGSGVGDESMSTAAYRKVGLFGSTDADGNAGGITAGDYGREIYFAAPGDINNPATDIAHLGVVEFRPTPRGFINYDSQSAAVMNAKADQGMAYFMSESRVTAGVHAIVGFTHAMFVMGSGNWQSLEGGQFQALDEHLSYLKRSYVDRGTLTFATASELVHAYMDYYTPVPVAVYGRHLSQNFLVDEFAIDVLGRDIPMDAEHIHTVEVKYPLYYHDSAFYVAILKNGQQIYKTSGLPTPFNDIRFAVDDGGAKYTLKVYHNRLLFRILTAVTSIKQKLLPEKDITK